MEYLERNLFKEVKKWIGRREIIVIKGPRQSGKTTLLEMIREWLIKEKMVNENNVILVSFEDRELLERFSVDPKGFVERYAGEKKSFFLIDEAHYCKELGQKLKLLYDTFKDIKFIVSGSSSFELTSQTAKFLVGRTFSFELFPFSFYEFLLAKDKKLARVYLDKNKKVREFIYEGKELNFEKEIFVGELSKFLHRYLIYGGYPEVVKGKNEEEKQIILKNIYDTYIEKDIVSFLQITDTIKFRKLVSMLSFNVGNLISYDGLVRDCNSYFKEILKFIDVLEQTYVLRLLRPFHKNLVTELKKNPKDYFLDLGLRNYAIANFNEINIREDRGKIAENFVLNELRKDNFSLNFWRTAAKAEVDFIISNLKEIIPIEVKFENMKKGKISKSFYSFLNSYAPKRAVVVTKDFFGESLIGETKIKFIPIAYL